MSQGREQGRRTTGREPAPIRAPSTLTPFSWPGYLLPISPTCCRAWDLPPATRRPLPPPGSAQREGRGPGLALRSLVGIPFLSSPQLESRGSEDRPSTSRRPAPRLTHRPRDARQAGIHVPPPARLALRAQARTRAHARAPHLALRSPLSAPNAQAIRTPEAGACPRCPPKPGGGVRGRAGSPLTPPLLSPLPTLLALPTSFRLPLPICPTKVSAECPSSLPSLAPHCCILSLPSPSLFTLFQQHSHVLQAE